MLCFSRMQIKERIKHLPTMRDVQQIKREVRSLRSFFISMVGEDPEGNYKPEFVKKMRKSIDDKPIYAYAWPGSLLKQLKDV